MIEDIGKIKTAHSIEINNEIFNVLNYEELFINDENDWVTEFVLLDSKNVKHKLKIIFNEDRDYEFIGAFLDNILIDIKKIKIKS